jgi:hypothetical protein
MSAFLELEYVDDACGHTAAFPCHGGRGLFTVRTLLVLLDAGAWAVSFNAHKANSQ